MTLWPFVDQMNPNRGTPPPEVKDVDLNLIQPGQTRMVQWRSVPVFIRNRTPQETQLARSRAVADLPDRLARTHGLPANTPADDSNRTRGQDNWLVVVGLCTHMGCLLKPQHGPAAIEADEGWFCPCHAARFDLSGRVRSGPARTNLAVPPYSFLSNQRLRIGES
jgi:ubiquinol-cytochrome c reductase iron-sulfur subunit